MYIDNSDTNFQLAQKSKTTRNEAYSDRQNQPTTLSKQIPLKKQ